MTGGYKIVQGKIFTALLALTVPALMAAPVPVEESPDAEKMEIKRNVREALLPSRDPIRAELYGDELALRLQRAVQGVMRDDNVRSSAASYGYSAGDGAGGYLERIVMAGQQSSGGVSGNYGSQYGGGFGQQSYSSFLTENLFQRYNMPSASTLSSSGGGLASTTPSATPAAAALPQQSVTIVNPADYNPESINQRIADIDAAGGVAQAASAGYGSSADGGQGGWTANSAYASVSDTAASESGEDYVTASSNTSALVWLFCKLGLIKPPENALPGQECG